MTIGELLRQNQDLDRLETELLVAESLQLSRADVMARPEIEIGKAQEKRINRQLSRLKSGEPLAYILGHKEFYGLDFIVNTYTLIPRPETELMVEEALRISRNAERVTIIDVGTGSGCIAITLAKALEFKIIAIDISKRALATARKNAKRNGVSDRIEFMHGNLLRPLLKISDGSKAPCACMSGGRAAHYVICANLPYLTPEQVRTSPTIQHEPKSALISGADGLKHYRQLFRQAKKLDAAASTLLCEIDDTQGAAMSKLIEKELPQAKYEIKQDLGGYDRLAVIDF
jgi:release factor glutamine methyltransferase